MSLETNLRSLTIRLGNESKALRTLLNGNRADNASLTTTAKGNLVASINELHQMVQNAAGAGNNINDSSTSSGATWSSQKTSDAIAALKTEIMGPNVEAALDTIKEIGDQLRADGSAITAIQTGLANRLRIDAAQSLTAAQQLQGRQNLSVLSAADIGDPTVNFVTLFETTLAA